MTNREVYFSDPTTQELLNNGVSKVSEIGQDERQISTLRFELETFVCDGEYAKGLERILRAYLAGLGRSEQQAAWVSGFFGSGKSHLVKVLRYLWEDCRFADGATARSLVRLPAEISDLLTELTSRSKPLGGLRAAAGTLGAGSMDNVRLAFIQLILRAAGLPENLAQARFLLWLRSSGLEPAVQKALAAQKRDLRKEVANLKLSTALAEALVAADPKYGTTANAQAAIRADFPDLVSPTMSQAGEFLHSIFGTGDRLPCTLLVVDEVQQFIGEKIQRAMDVQEIAEYCSTKLDQRLLLIGTGQSALPTTPALQRLQARFGVRVQLSDSDVEGVIRKTVLRKKPQKQAAITKCLDANQGELARHLQNTRLAATHQDEDFFVADYPLLPTRRRFWEKVLRNTDESGSKAQLRSQLQIVFEAAKQTADAPVGTVVPADFIYDQISTDLVNSGHLEREYDEIIRKQRDGTAEGALRSSLCALIFLIGKLPRTPGSDDGVRATTETLVDLLVSDLKNDRPRLEQQVPVQLKKLVEAGDLMAVETEFSLQTVEGKRWTHEFSRRRTAVLNDGERINARRSELLRETTKVALKPVSLKQGSSRESRQLAFELSSSRPESAADRITLWLRDGWSDEEKTVLNDARAAGVDSPLLFGYLPRAHHDELRQAIAAQIAARETLDANGASSAPEAVQARKAIETHLAVASHRIDDLLRRITGAAKVFTGGGLEAHGLELADKVQASATSGLERLFPNFSEADHVGWSQVLTRARAGDASALGLVNHPGDVTKHPVCRQVLAAVGAGKKGREIREQFKSAPYGWTQDAIDGALLILMVAGNLRATLNGQPVQASSLPQNQIGSASYYVDVPPVDVKQRLELKALFQKAGITMQGGREPEAAAQFLQAVLTLAAAAGGEAPRPELPDTRAATTLQQSSGNEQLGKIHTKREELAASLTAWKKSADTITKRWPAWERLLSLHHFASGLPEAEECGKEITAITESRSLLAVPDPVPELASRLTAALRLALGRLQDDLATAFTAGGEKLAASQVWGRLTDAQRATLSATCQLTPPARDPAGTDEEILSALRLGTLADRRNRLDAVPQRFTQALDEASRLLEPRATRLTLPAATISSPAELDRWLSGVRTQVEEQLQHGPVILHL